MSPVQHHGHTKVRDSSSGPILKGHSALHVVQVRLHPARQPTKQPARWPSGMVTGDPQRLPQGRSGARRLSRTPRPEQGPPKKSRKKLQVIICVLLVELFERFTFFGIVCNMILFCTMKLGYDNYLAATVNLCFVGASTLTPVLVGWFAETCLGRTKVLYLCAFLHFFGKKRTCSLMSGNLKLFELKLLLSWENKYLTFDVSSHFSLINLIFASRKTIPSCCNCS